jgi:hypothetical protein
LSSFSCARCEAHSSSGRPGRVVLPLSCSQRGLFVGALALSFTRHYGAALKIRTLRPRIVSVRGKSVTNLTAEPRTPRLEQRASFATARSLTARAATKWRPVSVNELKTRQRLRHSTARRLGCRARNHSRNPTTSPLRGNQNQERWFGLTVAKHNAVLPVMQAAKCERPDESSSPFIEEKILCPQFEIPI